MFAVKFCSLALLLACAGGHAISLDFARDNARVKQSGEYFDTVLQLVNRDRSFTYRPDVSPLLPALFSAAPYLALEAISLQSGPVTIGSWFPALGLLAGTGQFYLGSYPHALLYAAGVGGLFFYFYSDLLHYAGTPARDDPGVQEKQSFILTGGIDLDYLSIFDAYQLSRLFVRNRGYRTPLTYTSAGSLIKAPFQKEYILRTGTIIPLGIVVLLSAIGYTIDRDAGTTFTQVDPVLFGQPRGRPQAFFLGTGAAGAISMGAGVGEEAFYRGVLQNELSVYLGPLLGWVSASALFGLAHYQQSQSMDKVYFTSALGAYLGLLYHHNQYDLRQSVAVHFWWDFFLFLESFLGRPNAGSHLLNVRFNF
jgi:membrane protease YdiL (CAAX protease family)